MSRETDTPSTDGRGAQAAYPSGTPPYGTPMVSDGGADAGRPAARPEERKTETTVTTRIRINIPGSRPIPPVVVRKPVGEGEAESGDPEVTAAMPAVPSGPAAPELPAQPSAPAAEEKTSDWFAPRKSGPAKGGPGGGGTNGAGIPGGSAAAAGPGAPGGSAGSAGSAPRPAGARPGGVVGSMSSPGKRSGLPGGATGGPVALGHGGGTGSFDVTEAVARAEAAGGPSGSSSPRGNGALSGMARDFPDPGDSSTTGQHAFPDSSTGQTPYPDGSTTAQNPFPDQHNFSSPNGNGYSDTNGRGIPTAGLNGLNGLNGGYPETDGMGIPSGPGGPGGPLGAGGPSGPTSGPVTGDGPAILPAGPGAPGTAPGPGGPGLTHGLAQQAVTRTPLGPGVPGTPGASGAPGTGRLPGGGLSDDTAILTPQKQAPGGFRADGNVSGQTVTSGIPVVPPAGQTPPKSGKASGKKAGKGKKQKKGRGKLGLLVGLVVVAGAGVYGAGLLLNHSDVPKGTTVLGVDIGGGTRDEAVKKLDDAFGARAQNAKVQLKVGDKEITLQPDQSGLQFDIPATVDSAAGSDYNPVSVVGALFGQQRVIAPDMPVDEEKLQAAIESASGGTGSVTDGTIKFEDGKAVAVYGKAGQGIDTAKAVPAVEAAYRTQVETGKSTVVSVPTTSKQPTVSNAEVDRMMKAFAEPAMSAKVTIQTPGGAQSILFGPKSLPKIISFKAVDGKLVDSYNLEALKEAYGSTFDGVQITTATGKRALLPQDVVNALRKALVGTTSASRIGTIETNPT